MRWYVIGPILVVLFGAGVWFGSRNQRESRFADNARLRVIFTGETLGEIEPCNCSGKMAGGLPARGGYIEQQTGPFVLLDVGCLGNGTRDFEVLRAEATLRAMKVLGYDAVNVGEHELWLQADGLARLSALGVPFVSANVLDESNKPVVAPFIRLRHETLSVTVTGVVDAKPDSLGSDLQVDIPREALGRLIPQLRQQADVIVVLADLELQAVTALARDYPEITLILFRGRGDSLPPQVVNRTTIASIYGESLYVGDLTLRWDENGQVSTHGEAILLDDRFSPSQAVVQSSVNWYKTAIAGRMFDLNPTRPGWQRITAYRADPGNAFVGSEACKTCHAHQYQRWSANRHAHAMDSLKDAGYDWSPECVVCHVVGYGADDGYQSMQHTPLLGRVGCEACHGAGKILLDGSCKDKARHGNEATCRLCHTPKHHPDFEFEKHWALIDHTNP